MTDSRRPSPIRDWEDEWKPPGWTAPKRPSTDASRTDRESADPWHQQRKTYPPKPAQIPRDMLLLAIAPGVTAILAALLWLLSPLPVAGRSAVSMFIIAAIQAAIYFLTKPNRPLQISMPFLIDLTGTVGLLPLLAIQVSLMREPYVALSEGSAWPAIAVTIISALFLVAVGVSAAFRFWAQPDQAGLVFLPLALMIPAAIGNRGPITIDNGLAVLAISMFIGALATVAAAPLTISMRLIVPPAALAVEIIVLWLTDRGPVFHPTSGTIVSFLYVAMLAIAIALVVLVPIIAVRIRMDRLDIEPVQAVRGERRAEISPPARARFDPRRSR